MNKITVTTVVEKDIDATWGAWTNPEHITNWNFASDDWMCPHATNDLTPGGTFSYRMEAKAGDVGFDFSGTYDVVEKPHTIGYTLGDGRKTEIHFIQKGSSTEVIETFDAETENPLEMQQQGWQSILNNFKKYTESL